MKKEIVLLEIMMGNITFAKYDDGQYILYSDDYDQPFFRCVELDDLYELAKAILKEVPSPLTRMMNNRKRIA